MIRSHRMFVLSVGCSLLIGCLRTVPALAAESEQETYGARPDALGPIGGGEGYQRIVTHGDYKVETIDELVDALKKAKAGQIIYVDEKAELDLTVRVRAQEFFLELPAGVTLASNRGAKGAKGALIYSDEFNTQPLILVSGEKARVTGLRIRGPDPKTRMEELPRLIKVGGSELYYKFPTSDGIKCAYPHLEVDNCEISGWGHGGVYLYKGGTKAHIHHNYIHHCQRRGLGYCVSLNEVEALIESNIFADTRHAIAGTGAPGTSYEARNNIVEGQANGHSFDMHGGSDRGDGTNIAGDWIKIHHNTFKAKWKAKYALPICIRGVPAKSGEIHHNWFLHKYTDRYHTCRQSGANTLQITRNVFGPDRVFQEVMKD